MAKPCSLIMGKTSNLSMFQCLVLPLWRIPPDKRSSKAIYNPMIQIQTRTCDGTDQRSRGKSELDKPTKKISLGVCFTGTRLPHDIKGVREGEEYSQIDKVVR